MATKHSYALIVPNPPGPKNLEHPETHEAVASWTYQVKHTETTFWGREKLKEVFDFRAKKIYTLETKDKKQVISNIADFEGREADVQKAYDWMKQKHPNWYFVPKAPIDESQPVYSGSFRLR